MSSIKNKEANLPPIPDSLDLMKLIQEYRTGKSPDQISAIIKDLDGNEIFDVPFTHDNRAYKSIKTLTPYSTEIPKQLRGKGLASDIYKRAEADIGSKIIPDSIQLPGGFHLHDKYGFGNKFGMSEDELMSKLSSEDKMARIGRKEALRQVLDKAQKEGYGKGITDVLESGNDDLYKLLRSDMTPNADSVYDLFNHSLYESLKEAGDSSYLQKLKSNIPKYLSKVKSVAPVALTGGLGLAISGASEAADTEAMGGSEEQEALERDLAAHKQQKQIEQSDVPKDVKLKALELFKKNRLPF